MIKSIFNARNVWFQNPWMKNCLFLLGLTFIAQTAFGQVLEAENAMLTDGAKEIQSASHSGGYYVAQNNGNLTFYFRTAEDAFFNVYLTAAVATAGTKANALHTGDVQCSFFFSEAQPTEKRIATGLKLSAGINALEIRKNQGSLNIDYLRLEAIRADQRFAIDEALVTPEPTANAQRLHQFLKDTYGRKIISGVMTLKSMDMVNWLKTNTGKEPALVGLDFMHSGRNYDWYNDQEPVNDARNYYNRRGIPVFCWHWRDPSRKTEEFYTAKTAFDVRKINDPSSEEYAAMISDIDYIAGLLKILHDEDIPVIWRPLHEAAGGWFWWGAKGPEACKKLYQVMWDRMVNHHGLKNLIWAWTREPNDDAWYPGDEYIDIVGRDIYQQGNHTSQFGEFSDMNNRYGQKKMITISECGSFPDVDNLVRDGAAWLYYMPWYGEFTTSAEHNTLTLWKKMFAHSYVITLNEMPDLRTYVAAQFPTEPDPSPGIVTSTHDGMERTFLQIFPTVVTDGKLKIKSSGRIGGLSIIDMKGKEVQRHHFSTDTATVAVPAEPGVYLLKPRKSGETLKFIVR